MRNSTGSNVYENGCKSPHHICSAYLHSLHDAVEAVEARVIEVPATRTSRFCVLFLTLVMTTTIKAHPAKAIPNSIPNPGRKPLSLYDLPRMKELLKQEARDIAAHLSRINELLLIIKHYPRLVFLPT